MTGRAVPDLAKKLAARAIDGRSRIYQWVRENYDELATARLTLRPPPTWQVVADLASEVGLRDAANKPPSPAAMRKAFERVALDIRAGNEGGPAGEARPAAAPVPTVSLPPARRPVKADHDPRTPGAAQDGPHIPATSPVPRPKLILKPARLPEPGEAWRDDGSALPKPIR